MKNHNNEKTCSSCKKDTTSFADDLFFEVILSGERIVIPNLTGLRCSFCGETVFDANSIKIIDKYVAGRIKGGYQSKISNVGGGKIGIYFPKDIFRVMKINKGDKAILTPLSKRKMIIELLND